MVHSTYRERVLFPRAGTSVGHRAEGVALVRLGGEAALGGGAHGPRARVDRHEVGSQRVANLGDGAAFDGPQIGAVLEARAGHVRDVHGPTVVGVRADLGRAGRLRRDKGEDGWS